MRSRIVGFQPLRSVEKLPDNRRFLQSSHCIEKHSCMYIANCCSINTLDSKKHHLEFHKLPQKYNLWQCYWRGCNLKHTTHLSAKHSLDTCSFCIHMNLCFATKFKKLHSAMSMKHCKHWQYRFLHILVGNMHWYRLCSLHFELED